VGRTRRSGAAENNLQKDEENKRRCILATGTVFLNIYISRSKRIFEHIPFPHSVTRPSVDTMLARSPSGHDVGEFDDLHDAFPGPDLDFPSPYDSYQSQPVSPTHHGASSPRVPQSPYSSHYPSLLDPPPDDLPSAVCFWLLSFGSFYFILLLFRYFRWCCCWWCCFQRLLACVCFPSSPTLA